MARGLGNVLMTHGPGPLDRFTCQADQWVNLLSLLTDSGYKMQADPGPEPTPAPPVRYEECVDCARPISSPRYRCQDCQQEHNSLKHWAPPRPRARYARPM